MSKMVQGTSKLILSVKKYGLLQRIETLFGNFWLAVENKVKGTEENQRLLLNTTYKPCRNNSLRCNSLWKQISLTYNRGIMSFLRYINELLVKTPCVDLC